MTTAPTAPVNGTSPQLPSPSPVIGGVLRSALYGAAVAIGGGLWALSELRTAGKELFDRR